MHVIANSDTNYDQELKLKVRDAVLLEGEKLFDGSITSADAIKKLTPHIERLEKAALNIIESNGYDYNVKITVEKEYFKTRVYDNSVTLPAGYYTAIKVVIGEGKGENWWCVMFPPMCLPGATDDCELENYLENNEIDVVKGNGKYKIKFKIVEFLEELLNIK